MHDSAGVANNLITFSRHSTKLNFILKSTELDYKSTTLRPLCFTRVLYRGPAFSRVLDKLDNVLEAPQQYVDTSVGHAAVKTRGFIQVIGQGNVVIGVRMALQVLGLLENLNRSVQSSHLPVSSMLLAMQTTNDSLRHLRNETVFQSI